MRKLHSLTVNEISLVGKGANKKKFLVTKSNKGKSMPSQEILNLINSVSPEKMTKIVEAIKKADGDMAPGPDSHVFKETHNVTGGGMSDRAQAAMKATARILAPFKDEIHGGHMDAMQKELGMKDHGAPQEGAQAGAPAEPQKDEDGGDEDIEMSVAYPQQVEEDHAAEALDMAKKAYKSHLEKMGYRKYPDQQPKVGSHDPNVEDDKVGKNKEEVVGKSATNPLSAFSPAQQAQLDLIFKSNQTLTDANKQLVEKSDRLEKELRAERDERLNREFKQRASQFKHLGANTDELATVMKSLSETDSKAFDKVESILKAANEQMRTSALFGEIGSSMGPGSPVGDAMARLDTLVDSVVQKSDGKRTREQIFDEVLKTAEGKRLYAEYKNARPHGI